MKDVTYRREQAFLCDKAFFSADTRGRKNPASECPVRTEFQRDRDRIVHSKCFRRLMHKTQAFISPEGDHYRTRLTHTLEVTQIARTIARELRLNEDLVEAAAMGHDLGHTPFGHAGERALDKLCSGGFKHNEQSLRLSEKLENDGAGLNLTYEVNDGILNHCGDLQAQTFEGRLVKFADRIAYINHDIDDAIRANLLSLDDIPKDLTEILGSSHSDRITSMVSAVILNGTENDIGMTEPFGTATNKLRDFLFVNIYRCERALAEERKIINMVTFLFEYFISHQSEIPQEYRRNIADDGLERSVCDYIAGMTDRYAIACFEELFIPNVWQYK